MKERQRITKKLSKWNSGEIVSNVTFEQVLKVSLKGVYFAESKEFLPLLECPYTFYVNDLDWNLEALFLKGVTHLKLPLEDNCIYILKHPHHLFVLLKRDVDFNKLYYEGLIILLNNWMLMPFDSFSKEYP